MSQHNIVGKHCNQRTKSATGPKIPREIVPKESDDQKALARYLDARFGYYGWCSYPAERIVTGKSGVFHLQKLKAMGLRDEFPDILIFEVPKVLRFPVNGVAIELKRAHYGRLRSGQSKWGEELVKRGWLWFAAYGLDDAIRRIEEVYGKRERGPVYEKSVQREGNGAETDDRHCYQDD
jgi:hypothetical protein